MASHARVEVLRLVDGGGALLAQGAVGWCDAAGLLAAAATAAQQPRTAVPDATLYLGTMVLALPQLLAGLAQTNQLMPPLAEEYCSIWENGARALTLRVQFPPTPPPPPAPAPAPAPHAAASAPPAAPVSAAAAAAAVSAAQHARQQPAAAAPLAASGSKGKKEPYRFQEVRAELHFGLSRLAPVETVTKFSLTLKGEHVVPKPPLDSIRCATASKQRAHALLTTSPGHAAGLGLAPGRLQLRGTPVHLQCAQLVLVHPSACTCTSGHMRKHARAVCKHTYSVRTLVRSGRALAHALALRSLPCYTCPSACISSTFPLSACMTECTRTGMRFACM